MNALSNTTWVPQGFREEKAIGKNVTINTIIERFTKLDPSITTTEKASKETNDITIVTMVDDKRVIYQYCQSQDCIHGPIHISNIAKFIIDTPEFQELGNLRQLGMAYKVYRNSTHSRFEHSLGVYHLTKQLLASIKRNTPMERLNKFLSNIPELEEYYESTYQSLPHHKLDNFACELIAIAALCHDLGHGPFSHSFDDLFIKKMSQGKPHNPLHEHELRSCTILEMLIQRDPLLRELITQPLIQFIKDLIEPRKGQISWVYQIVSNSLNGIDMDKFDYLLRDARMNGIPLSFEYNRLIQDAKVIDDKICYQKQMAFELYTMFYIRYRMHLQMYSHKTVVGLSYMMCDIMVLLDPIMGIYDSLADMSKFRQFTDTYIIERLKMYYDMQDKLDLSDDDRDRVNQAYGIWMRIQHRDLYKCVCRLNTKSKISEGSIQQITNNPDIDQSKILIHQGKIGLVSGQKGNPIEDLYLYTNKQPDRCFHPTKDEVSSLVPDNYQEHLLMVYVTERGNKDLIDRVSKIVEAW